MVKRIIDVSNKRTKILLIATMCLMPALSACEGHYVIQRDPQVVASPDKVSLMLAEAADKASSALETLAAVEQSKAPAVAVQPIHNAPPELTRAMTVSWIGPAEELLQKLADRASYTYINVGDVPPSPLTVSVDVENMPVIDILRDVGLQLGMRGDVKVDSTRRMIELHYAPVTGMGR
jgi:defect in organelle trafficking protein DotD